MQRAESDLVFETPCLTTKIRESMCLNARPRVQSIKKNNKKFNDIVYIYLPKIQPSEIEMPKFFLRKDRNLCEWCDQR